MTFTQTQILLLLAKHPDIIFTKQYLKEKINNRNTHSSHEVNTNSLHQDLTNLVWRNLIRYIPDRGYCITELGKENTKTTTYEEPKKTNQST